MHSDVRIVTATNKDIQQLVEQGLFREDLFYRLNVITINILPLRERKDDIKLLTNTFIKEFCQKYGKVELCISPAVMNILINHPWKGNVRELRNAIEHAVVLAEHSYLQPEDLPDSVLPHSFQTNLPILTDLEWSFAKVEFEKNYLSVSERKLVAHQQSVLETSNDKNELQAAIDQLTSIRDNQIKSEIVKQEISDSIYYGTIKLEEIIEAEEAEEAAKAAAQQQISSPNRGEITSGTASSASGNAIVSYAYNFIGTPYVYGATGPDTFDCSGFTSYVYANAAGINITRTTYSQMGVGTPVSYDELQPGDLVFTYGGDHVGIYVGGGQYIHAPQPGDSVKVGNITSFYCARRVL